MGDFVFVVVYRNMGMVLVLDEMFPLEGEGDEECSTTMYLTMALFFSFFLGRNRLYQSMVILLVRATHI